MKRIQNRVAESRAALFVAIVYAAGVWLLAGMASEGLYAQFGMVMVSTLLMLALNNVNALIRIYSRMVSCSFLVMTSAAVFLFRSWETLAVQLCFVLFYLSIFRSYQDKRSPGVVFYSFLFLGLASLLFVHILFFVPFLWFIMAFNLMAMSGRMWVASLLGLALPYWLGAAWLFYSGQPEWIVDHFRELAEFTDISEFYATASFSELQSPVCTFILVALVSAIGIVHFLRSSYQDKIRTRMLYETFITVDILTMVFIVVQPQHVRFLLPVMIVNAAPLMGHFIALTRTRATNVLFLLLCAAMAALTAFNIWQGL